MRTGRSRFHVVFLLVSGAAGAGFRFPTLRNWIRVLATANDHGLESSGEKRIASCHVLLFCQSQPCLANTCLPVAFRRNLCKKRERERESESERERERGRGRGRGREGEGEGEGERERERERARYK